MPNQIAMLQNHGIAHLAAACDDPFVVIKKDCNTGSERMQDDLSFNFREKSAQRYYLGKPYGGTYLTSREVETMANLILGKTIRETGIAMQISPRTAEFYLNNIKRKLKCRTKKELIRKVISNRFLERMGLLE